MNHLDYNKQEEDMRVPISFRVSIRKKRELMLCAEKFGCDLTSVLEILTENPQIAIKYNIKDLFDERNTLLESLIQSDKRIAEEKLMCDKLRNELEVIEKERDNETLKFKKAMKEKIKLRLQLDNLLKGEEQK